MITTKTPVVYKVYDDEVNYHLEEKYHLQEDTPSEIALGLRFGDFVLPFEKHNRSWAEASSDAKDNKTELPTAEEIFAAWTPQVAEDFNACVAELGVKNATAEEVPIPIRDFPEDWKYLREVDKHTDAPFYHLGRPTKQPRTAPKADTPTSHVGIGNKYANRGLNTKELWLRRVWRMKE